LVCLLGIVSLVWFVSFISPYIAYLPAGCPVAERASQASGGDSRRSGQGLWSDRSRCVAYCRWLCVSRTAWADQRAWTGKRRDFIRISSNPVGSLEHCLGRAPRRARRGPGDSMPDGHNLDATRWLAQLSDWICRPAAHGSNPAFLSSAPSIGCDATRERTRPGFAWANTSRRAGSVITACGGGRGVG
jgi:hypothetical protein